MKHLLCVKHCARGFAVMALCNLRGEAVKSRTGAGWGLANSGLSGRPSSAALGSTGCKMRSSWAEWVPVKREGKLGEN